MSLKLTFGCPDSDLMQPILNGNVTPDGIELETIANRSSWRHRQFFDQEMYDICEVSLASYLSSRSDPDANRFTAIPVFPNRRFRHSFVYRHADADISDLGELAGKKVATQSWQTTATVWMRGIAQEHYGLDLEEVSWYRRKKDDIDTEVPNRFDIHTVSRDHSAESDDHRAPIRNMLFSGELDAAMDPSGSLFNAVIESDSVEFLFDNPLQEEQQYFKKTGIHPIMHLMVIRDEVVEEYPWVADCIYKALRKARDRALKRNSSPSTYVSITWAHLVRAQQREIMGPEEEVWEYGLTKKTRHELDTFIKYAHGQGLIPERYDPEELFVGSTLGSL